MGQSWTKAHDSSKNTFWENYPSIASPIIDTELNRNEVSVDTVDDRVITLDTTKAEQSDLLQAFKDVSLDSTTGVITFTLFNNTTKTIDTLLEKIAINFDYDDNPSSPHYQNLVIELEDGTYKYIDMSALITQYEFTDSSCISWTIGNDGSVTANIIDGSITGAKLQPNYLADCLSAKSGAENAEADAIAKALVAEGYANGKQNGVPVTSGSPYYENNAEYFKDQAQSIVGSKVDSFNGRTGVVTSQSGDYTQDQIGVPSTASVGQVPIVANVGGSLTFTMGTPSAGLLPHLTIEADPNTTVTVAKGGTTITATETSSGIYDCDVDNYGTWVISSIRSGSPATLNLDVDTVKSYYIDASYYFLSTITVAYPTGATVVCTDNDPISPTEYTATESPYTFKFNATGTWVIKMTYNGITKTEATDTITATGQTFTHNLQWDKTSLAGINRILNYHAETDTITIGDEVDITVNGSSWTMQVAGRNVYNSHDIMFTSKDIWVKCVSAETYTSSQVKTNAQNFYSAIEATDKQYIKQVTRSCRGGQGGGNPVSYSDYCFVLGNKETANATSQGVISGQVQMPLFTTQSNRVKKYQGTATAYWTSDYYNNSTLTTITSSGSASSSSPSSSLGVVPSFMLIADS